MLSLKLAHFDAFNTQAASLAFALTDFKWQGKTVRRLLISLARRNFMPWLSLTSLYTMRTRTRCRNDQRTVGFDPLDANHCAKLRSMAHPAALRIWHAAYDEEGRWCPERASAEAAAMLRMGRGQKRRAPSAAPAQESEPEQPEQPAGETEYDADYECMECNEE